MADENKVEQLLNTESMIKRLLGDMERLRVKIKEQKDMYDSSFESDAIYSEKLKKEDEVKKEKEGLRQKILKSPAVIQTDAKIKELKGDLKDTQKSMESYLKQYQALSGSNQITREDGEIYEIVTSYKLKKVNSSSTT